VPSTDVGRGAGEVSEKGVRKEAVRSAVVALVAVALVAVALVALTAVLAPAEARAGGAVFNDPYDVPPAPRPPTLPELTHSEPEGTLESTVGAILPNGGGGITHAYVQRFTVEEPLGLRRWYVGANYELAAGSGRVVSGNLELQGRTLWATRTGLAFGGGLALVVPTAQFDDGSPAAKTALYAASLRPWDVPFFVPSAIGARPFVDIRAIDGPFVAQFRQSLELLTTTNDFGSPAIYATVGLYLGLWVTPRVAAGLEAFEAYAIDVPNVSDGARAAVVISPSVRLVLPWVEPAISAFTNIGTPLQGASDRIWGFRFAFTVVYDAAREVPIPRRAPDAPRPTGARPP
jgi:hypothetical protein